MRVLGLALAGVLAVSTQIAAHADQPGGGAARGSGRSSSWNAPPGAGQWKGGWGSQHEWRANRNRGGWGPNAWPGVPTYWVWGPGGGFFDYPFADWRGPTGGWGNP